MTKEEFKLRFNKSIKECVEFAGKLIYGEIPHDNIIKLNLYSVANTEKFTRLSRNEALERLYKDGKIPMWINIGIVKIDGNNVIIKCDYGEEFTDNDGALHFFNDNPLSPFSITSPPYSKKINHDREKKFHLEEFDEEAGQLKK